jgi:putative ABC transport system ATP-binding protein
MTTIEARLEHATKEYGDRVRTRALTAVDLEIRGGQVTLLLGPSGSGKTTLLNLLGGLDQPTEGKVIALGQNLGALNRRGLTLFRRKNVGFVFQLFNLVPSLTASENVQVAAALVGRAGRAGREDAHAWLERVGLGGMGHRFPSELSGGQQQRVAIARALAKRPRLLFADEPTGALDHEAGARVVSLIVDAARSGGCAVVVVTHDETLSAHADRVVRLRDGRIVSDRPTAAAEQAT